MIAIGTERLTGLLRDGIVNLEEFCKNHPDIKYVETSLDYDNDIFLRPILPKSVTVLTRVQSVTDLEMTLGFHSVALGRKDFVALLPSTLDWFDETVRSEISWASKAYNVGGLWGVREYEQVEEYRMSTGWYPEYVSFDINPLKYPKTLMDYCERHGIKTIGHGIFGGVWSGYLRSMFPDAFLYDFARTNVHIPIISGEDVYFLEEMEQRKGKVEKALVKYSKDIDKLPARSIPPRRVHGKGTVEIEGYGKADFMGEQEWSMKEPEYKVSEGMEPVWTDTDLPQDLDPDTNPTAYHRYHVEPWLDENYSPKWWKKVWRKVAPDFWAIKLTSRFWFIPKEHMFWLIRGKLYKTPLSRPDILSNV